MSIALEISQLGVNDYRRDIEANNLSTAQLQASIEDLPRLFRVQEREAAVMIKAQTKDLLLQLRSAQSQNKAKCQVPRAKSQVPSALDETLTQKQKNVT